MIGKVITGKSFGGCLAYLLNRQEAAILEAEGVRMQNARTATEDFNLQRKMNPDLGKAVGHIILSWSKEDLPKLTPEIMAERAREYLEKMQIKNTQYLIVQHIDRQHPHVHIVYNRVDNQGKTISDRFQKQQNVRVCKAMTMRHGYHLAKGKQQVNRQRLTGADKIRYQLHDTIKGAAYTAKSWQELKKRLGREGIDVHYKYQRGTNQVQGISFSKEGVTFKGSAIDRAFSYSKLNTLLEQNRQREFLSQAQKRSLSLGHEQSRQPDAPRQEHSHVSHSQTESMLDILLTPVPGGGGPDPFEEELKRRKKKRKSKGMSL